MRSITASLHYFVHLALRTLRYDDEVISYFFTICCTLPSVFSYIYDFIEFLDSVEVGVEVVVEVEGIRKILMIGGEFVIPGIITYGLYIGSFNPYACRFVSLLLSIICCFTLILTSLYGEITSPFSWLLLSLGGNLLLQLLFNTSLIPINMRSSLVIRHIHHYCFMPITHSRRYGICLRFTGILMVISMISTSLLPDRSLATRSQLLFSIGFIFVNFELPTQSVSSFYITVDIGPESADTIDWSHLPPDLARGIVNRMTTYKNYIAAIGVSQGWRSACSGISRGLLLPLPALMLTEPVLTDMRTLFSLYDNNHHRLQLSEVRGKRIWGSQHGWVVTLGPRYVTQLVHLMSGNRINLPQIQRLAPREEWFCLVHKFNLLKDPTDESSFLVIAIFGPMNSLAFTRVRLGAALNRRGEGEWVVVANSKNLKFRDVVHFHGQIYALCDNGKLVCFEPDASFANMVQVIADHPQDVGAHRKIYLVESLGNLYGVFRNGFLIPSESRFETTSFFVYKFNFNASAWEEVTHLEGQAFFVGDSNSFSRRFPTSIIPSRSDCIYFTDDHWVWRKFPRKAYGGHDVGLFDMATRGILPLKFGKDKPRFYSRPIFVTRSDRL
ncbi:hypothetical protein RGQ29_024647 [Quercus rubra]|uniref:KIB1-4 beta-propeller domain-containing protein n=1 Tax=Quercus rubra TaxID=3512 RepID=A0AAN7IKT0_QUERU|nr:hypothetical protein RGQ29_024647 [Quercus rubra]